MDGDEAKKSEPELPDWFDLLHRLKVSRGTPVLVAGVNTTYLETFLTEMTSQTLSMGQVASNLDKHEELLNSIDAHGDSVFLRDIEVLLSHQLQIDVLALLRQLAKRRALFVRWPGNVSVGRVTYSQPGRADYFDHLANDLIIMRATQSVFPDEVPYELERYPS